MKKTALEIIEWAVLITALLAGAFCLFLSVSLILEVL